MTHSEPMSAETARRRAQQAVDYYQMQVMPSYSDRGRISPPPHFYDSATRDRVNAVMLEANRARPGDGLYRNKQRGGAPDSRGSYSEKINRGPHRATIHGTQTKKSWDQHRTNAEASGKQNNKKDRNGNTTKRNKKGLHRSNSNLEMDSMEFLDDADLPDFTNLRREYGSTSSLDVLSTSSENFFDMLKDFRNEGMLDQRSPAPAKIKELLRGKLENNNIDKDNLNNEKIANGSVPIDNVDGNQSPKAKSKFKHRDRKGRAKSITAETGPGIFKKLRGKGESDTGAKTPENIADGDLGTEERLRQKSFVHFDCQSVVFNIADSVRSQNVNVNSRNITTGASAASINRNSYAADKDDPDILADTDEGDGKSNDLVLSCSFFRNELGGEEERVVSLTENTAHKRLNQSHSVLSSAITLIRSPACSGVAILDCSPTPTGHILPPLVSHRGHVMEYVDQGANYYRHFFYGCDHQNYFGVDESLGPVAISFRREKLEDRENNLGKCDYSQNQYRIIVRTSELVTLRGAILEDAIPPASRFGSSRGPPVKDILEYVVPELQTSCLKLATPGQKTLDQLLKLDEQGISNNYKVGVMYAKTGQSTEEEMYNNETGGAAFDEFLNCIGQKVRLKGFEKYRAQLDNKTDSTGIYSVYTSFHNSEIMFHVSTLLPYTPNNKQQLLRKRHIGNDIVTVVFQEAGALPFTPKTVRSHFQHVFIIVRVYNPCTENTRYSVAVTRSKDVPPFGPPIPENYKFSKSAEFADFLLAKIINAENAAHKSEKFRAMATRTRQEYLKDLAANYTTSTTLDSGSKLSKFALGSGRKKERSRLKVVPDLYANGAVIWNVQVEDFCLAAHIPCFLGIAAETLVLLEEKSKSVIFTVHCGAVIGWSNQLTSLRLYYNQGECLMLKPTSGEPEEIAEIIARLAAVTPGAETSEMSLKRNGLGQLGFHIQSEGIVTDVEHYGFAWEAGLRKNSRLVEICKVASITLTHEQMVDLLRTSATVKVVVIAPLDDGNPRGVATLLSNYQYSSLMALSIAIQPTGHAQSQKEANHIQKEANSPSSSEHALSQRNEHAQHHRGDINQNHKLGSGKTLYSPGARGSFTLPLQKKSQTRGEMKPVSNQSTVEYKQGSHSLQRGFANYHTYTDSTMSSGRGTMDRSSYDGHTSRDAEGFHSRTGTMDSMFGSGETNHARSGSKDSRDSGGDPPYSGSGTRQWNPRSSAQTSSHSQGERRWPDANSSGDSSSYGNYLSSAESTHSMASQQTSSTSAAFVPGRKVAGTYGDYMSVPRGNIALELLKQSQNSKYLLSHGNDSVRSGGNSANSSSNLSDMSFSSGSSHGIQSALVNQGDHPGYHGTTRDEMALNRKRADPAATNSKGRPGGVQQRKARLDVSPLSSENGSPRSSNRNLSGMSSEESLTMRLRPGVTTVCKPSKPLIPSNFQEELMRLIDPDISDSDLAGLVTRPRSHTQPGRLKRTMSDESLHSQKGTASTGVDNVSDFIFSTAGPAHLLALQRENLTREQRLSPRAVLDAAVTGRPKTAQGEPVASVPLPESTAGLDWRNLVTVATKAIEGEGEMSDKDQGQGEPHPTSYRQSPLERTGAAAASGSSVWQSTATNPQEKIQELELKLQDMTQELENERRENVALEAEVRQLRVDNVRLHEESQAAAAQLRKFTEWFFNTIDRQ